MELNPNQILVVEYDDNLNNHETTLAEVRERFKQETPEWLSWFMRQLEDNGKANTRFATYTIKKP